MIVRWIKDFAARRAEGRTPRPWSGERVDVDRFCAESWVDLLDRQRWLARAMKLQRTPWSVDQDAALIMFEREDGLVTAPVQIVGSWNPRTSLFTWGWDHPSVHVRLRADAERTRWFGDKHDLAELTQRSVRMSERDAWRATALAMKVNAAAGAYRGPTDGPVVFMTLGAPKLQTRD